jgi:hypothetical protein
MIHPAALLPHESICPKCKGEKVVECSGIHPRRPVGGVSAMEEPDTWTEDCDLCGATGVVLKEGRRSTPRTAMDDNLTRLVNMVSADRDDWRAEAARLVAENRRLRDVIDKAASTIERNHLSLPSAGSTPMESTRAAGGGDFQSESKGA